MKTHIYLLITLLSLMFCLSSKAQNIGIDTTAFNLNSLPDTINLNDNYNHTITVQNKSAIPYTGNIKLYAAIDSAGTIISADSVGVVFVSNFGLNDTVSISYNENYTLLNDYKLGGNIVVVWPIADFATTADSLSKNVYIKNPISVSETFLINDDLLIYPNPVKNNLFIKNIHRKTDVKQVRIFDIHGKLVLKDHYSSPFNVELLGTGIYFLELEFIDHSKYQYKIIKN